MNWLVLIIDTDCIVSEHELKFCIQLKRPSISVFPCQYQSIRAPYSSSSSYYSYLKGMRKKPENLETKQRSLGCPGALDRKVLSHRQSTQNEHNLNQNSKGAKVFLTTHASRGVIYCNYHTQIHITINGSQLDLT
jgi:hypothetical protein